jgi:prepilin-type N-terminal cleavage/methylation domain-containing protein
MKFLKKGSSRGFTIIEVVIVLAIAGLILLLVFQAVPALQRNNRNTQVRNQTATVFAGINDFITNNGGRMPNATNGVTALPSDAVVTIQGATGTTSVTVPNGGFTVTSSGTDHPASPGAINVVLNRRCDGNNVATTTTNRAYAALFRVEASGTPPTVIQCVES